MTAFPCSSYYTWQCTAVPVTAGVRRSSVCSAVLPIILCLHLLLSHPTRSWRAGIVSTSWPSSLPCDSSSPIGPHSHVTGQILASYWPVVLSSRISMQLLLWLAGHGPVFPHTRYANQLGQASPHPTLHRAITTFHFPSSGRQNSHYPLFMI